MRKAIEDHPDGGLLGVEEFRTLNAFQQKAAWQEKEKRPGLLADQLAAIGPVIEHIKAKTAGAGAEKKVTGRSTKPSTSAPKPRGATVTDSKPEQTASQPAEAETTHATDRAARPTSSDEPIKTLAPEDTAASIVNLAIVAERAELADLLERIDAVAFVKALLALLRDIGAVVAHEADRDATVH